MHLHSFPFVIFLKVTDPKAWQLSGTPIIDFISVWDLRVFPIFWFRVKEETGNDEDNNFVHDVIRIFG